MASHFVTTDDGFILKMFRLINSAISRAGDGEPKPVVFLLHGLASSAEAYVKNDENSLAFKLLEAGYDVWLGNSRGNIYSKEHTNKNIGDYDLFNYSFFEMGEYDLPAMIDFVLETTGETKLSYIGHS